MMIDSYCSSAGNASKLHALHLLDKLACLCSAARATGPGLTSKTLHLVKLGLPASE